MKKYHKSIGGILVLVTVFVSGCNKVEDPFVDRVVAPVLVVIEGVADGGGMTAEPVVSSKISAPVTISARIYDLDKSGILDNKVGIDSIPVTALAIKLTKRDGTLIADLTTDNAGKVSITKTWEQLGMAKPVSGSSISLTWTGTHKGQAFSRLSRIQGTN